MSRWTETQYEEARAIARDEASKALDRFRQEASRTPLWHRDREQIIQDILLDLVSRVTALVQRNLTPPTPTPVNLVAEDISLLVNKLEPLLRKHLTNIPLTVASPLAQHPMERDEVFPT